MQKLDRRTQRAIVEIIRERIAEVKQPSFFAFPTLESGVYQTCYKIVCTIFPAAHPASGHLRDQPVFPRFTPAYDSLSRRGVGDPSARQATVEPHAFRFGMCRPQSPSR